MYSPVSVWRDSYGICLPVEYLRNCTSMPLQSLQEDTALSCSGIVYLNATSLNNPHLFSTIVYTLPLVS